MRYRIEDYTALLKGKRFCICGPGGELRDAVEEIFRTHGGTETMNPGEADVLVCGLIPDAGLSAEEAMEIGFLHELPVIREAAGGMKARLSGNIVGVVPASAVYPSPGCAASAAAGAALEGYLRGIALDGAKFRLRANCVRYGYQIGERGKRLGEDVLMEGQPLRRNGTALDVAHAVLFLASVMSEYITGESLDVDGGVSAVGHNNVWNTEKFVIPGGEDGYEI